MASGLPTAFRHIKDNQKPLRFKSNGKFRILHLTDIHDVDPAMDDGVFSSGRLNEAPCPTNERRDEFESWVRTGDIAAAFFGHDHVNDFTENVEGIDLVQTIGAGYHTYGGERGGRLIILDENVLYKYETEIYRIDKISKGKV